MKEDFKKLLSRFQAREPCLPEIIFTDVENWLRQYNVEMCSVTPSIVRKALKETGHLSTVQHISYISFVLKRSNAVGPLDAASG